LRGLSAGFNEEILREAMNVSTYYFTDDGIIPNNRFPVIHYQKVIDVEDCSDWLEHTFERWHYVSANLS
jgi:uncharacterized protein YjlB